MSASARRSRVGTRFGPYYLKRQLGTGGMGEVYEAVDTVRQRVVALKLMSESLSHDPVFRMRMQREARNAGRLQEPHVVPIHDYGEIDGQLYLDMRLIEGTHLALLLERFGPVTPPWAVALVHQVASALDAAHAAGVMHRDVKPENILVTQDDFVYLVDFGIASAATDEKLTQIGSAVGTWRYMAPERFSDAEVNQRADIYSLTCVLHECLTGTPPYRADSAGMLITAHLMAPIPRPSQLRPGIPATFDAVIARGMAKRPEDRFASAGELAAAAHQALSAPHQAQEFRILKRSEEAGGLHTDAAAEAGITFASPSTASPSAPTPVASTSQPDLRISGPLSIPSFPTSEANVPLFDASTSSWGDLTAAPPPQAPPAPLTPPDSPSSPDAPATAEADERHITVGPGPTLLGRTPAQPVDAARRRRPGGPDRLRRPGHLAQLPAEVRVRFHQPVDGFAQRALAGVGGRAGPPTEHASTGLRTGHLPGLSAGQGLAGQGHLRQERRPWGPVPGRVHAVRGNGDAAPVFRRPAAHRHHGRLPRREEVTDRLAPSR
ncbi:transmembrane serine/threonine-protein kinase H PknH_2 [Mycobacterium liflandii 128FXT]|uniref:non-specific serine/threonine protein kinase n=1 Tax=Mycobacterium liflandii (strain 128FXT) TaxID=459424 RepID=L7V2L4_MYCL1|nr:serine/threonine-protein kinase [Mycobacterium liflandii]AGC62036.1 transmembrane serine/threonine-protein kinase H PknH_2 [Mycobacterium liflandii 128FXT]